MKTRAPEAVIERRLRRRFLIPTGNIKDALAFYAMTFADTPNGRDSRPVWILSAKISHWATRPPTLVFRDRFHPQAVRVTLTELADVERRDPLLAGIGAEVSIFGKFPLSSDCLEPRGRNVRSKR